MDRGHLSAISIKELGEMFMDTLQQAGPELLRADLEGIERHLQRLIRPVTARVGETVMATIAATQATVQPACASCGERARLVDPKRERQASGRRGPGCAGRGRELKPSPPSALHRSGRWHAFWRTQPQCRRPLVARHGTVTAVAALSHKSGPHPPDCFRLPGVDSRRVFDATQPGVPQ